MVRAKTLKLEVPAEGADRPQLGRVGAIAAAGFAVGIVWPWLAGVSLVPNPPVEDLAPVVEKEVEAPPAPSAPAASPAGVAPKQAVTVVERIKVGKPSITSCRDAEGRTPAACDPIPLEEALVPRLEALAGCKAAAQAQGVLSLGMKIDFTAGKVLRVLSGKSTTVSSEVADGLVKCAEQELAAASLASVPHNHAEYTVFYLVEIAAPGESLTDDEARNATKDDDVTPATGRATVAWAAARVRSGPAKDSEEVARLAAGARVKVVGRKGDWYKVQWDTKGSEGWVFKSAIGM